MEAKNLISEHERLHIFGNCLRTLRRQSTYWVDEETKVWSVEKCAEEMSKHSTFPITAVQVRNLEQGLILKVAQYVPVIVKTFNLSPEDEKQLNQLTGFAPLQRETAEFINPNLLHIPEPLCIIGQMGKIWGFNSLFAELYSLEEEEIFFLRENPVLVALFFEEIFLKKNHLDRQNLLVLQTIALRFFNTIYNQATERYHKIKEKLSPHALQSMAAIQLLIRTSNYDQSTIHHLQIKHSKFGEEPLTFVNNFSYDSIGGALSGAAPYLWLQLPINASIDRYHQYQDGVSTHTFYDFTSQQTPENDL